MQPDSAQGVISFYQTACIAGSVFAHEKISYHYRYGRIAYAGCIVGGAGRPRK